MWIVLFTLSSSQASVLPPHAGHYGFYYFFWDCKIMTYFPLPFLPSRSSHIPCLARFQIHDLSFTQSVAVCTYASVYIAISLKLRGLCNTIRMRVFRAEHLVLDDELIGLLFSQEDSSSYTKCSSVACSSSQRAEALWASLHSVWQVHWWCPYWTDYLMIG